MIALTSIAPKHHHEGIQEKCVRSWLEHGLKVYSFNGIDESKELSESGRFPGVEFISTLRTFEHQFGKPYVSVNTLLDFAKEQEDESIMILNSDIFLHNAGQILEQASQHDFCFAHRLDVAEVEPLSPGARPMPSGIDIFILKKWILHIFPQTNFAVGLTHWDYWLPWVAVKNGIKLFEIKAPFAYHKIHPQQWKPEIWQRMGHYCLWLTDYEGVIKPKPYLIQKDVAGQGNAMMRKIKQGR